MANELLISVVSCIIGFIIGVWFAMSFKIQLDFGKKKIFKDKVITDIPKDIGEVNEQEVKA
jgi:hypothetical protein